MRTHSSPSSITLLPSVIERIPVLLFAGDKDYICNHMGIEKMIDTMTWNGEKGLGVSPSFIYVYPLFLPLFYACPFVRVGC
jgi:hypothetical protein